MILQTLCNCIRYVENISSVSHENRRLRVALAHKDARVRRPRIRRHQCNGVERSHQRIDLGGAGRLIGDV